MLNDIVAEIGDADGPGGDDRSARRIAAVIGRMITSGSPAGRHPAADGARAVAPPRRVADDGQRGVAQPRRRRGDRGPRPQRHVRPAADRARAARAATGGSPRGPGTSSSTSRRARPTRRCCPTSARSSSRVGKQSLTSSYLDHPVLPALEDELRRLVAVPARGDHGRRRGDGRPRPRRPGRAAPRRPRRRRAPDVPAAARPARPARLRRHRRRRRRRGRRRRPGLRQALAGGGPRRVPAAARPEPGRRRR